MYLTANISYASIDTRLYIQFYDVKCMKCGYLSVRICVCMCMCLCIHMCMCTVYVCDSHDLDYTLKLFFHFLMFNLFKLTIPTEVTESRQMQFCSATSVNK